MRPFSFCVCALISNAFSFWVCSHFERVLILSAFSISMPSPFECALIFGVFSFWMRSHFECVLILSLLIQKFLSTHILHKFWRPLFCRPIAHKCYISSKHISAPETWHNRFNFPHHTQAKVKSPSLEIKGAFHSTKYFGFKFRVFYATNGTVFSGSLD